MLRESLTHKQLGDLLSWKVWLTPVLLAVLLIASSHSSFLLFHTLAEFFAIMVGVMMFVVALYTYPYARDNFLTYLAIGFFWIAGMDLAHALTYKGMAILAMDDANHPIQLWMIARFLEALLLLSAPFFLKQRLHVAYTFAFFGVVAATFCALIMKGYFPKTFVEGQGLTPFKIYGEYVICTILSVALINFYIHRHSLKDGIFPFLSAAIVLTICSELAFTLYTDLYGLANLIGHIFKLFAFWLIFYSIIRLSLKTPYESLHESEERFNLAMRGANDGLWDWNLETDEVYYSPRWKSMLGYDENELGSTLDVWGNLVHPGEKEPVLAKVQDYIEGRADSFVVEIRMRHKQGHWVNVLNRGFLVRRNTDNKAIRLVGTHVDITERKQLEEASRSQVHHLEGMQQIAGAMSRSLTSDDILDNVIKSVRETFASDRAWLFHPCEPDADFWEISVESTLPEYPGALALNQKLPMSSEVRQVFNDALNSTKPVVYCPAPSFGSNLDQFAVRSQMMMAIRPKFGKPWLLGLHQCSHERAWTDEEQKLFQDIGHRMSDMLSLVYLKHDLQKLSQAVQQAGEAVMITNQDAVIEYVNPAFTGITGYSPDEIIGQTPALLKSTAQDPVFYKELWDTITRGEVWHGTLIDRKKDGSFYPALMSIAPIHDGGGEITHYVAIQQDMTGYKKMEDQFLQAQKMEAIGTLVGGIAHDFNNMLAAIQGNVYLAKRKLKHQPEVDDKLDNIEQLGIRSADMVKQLLTFARKDRMELHALSLNSFIKEGFKLARTAIPENIDFVSESCQEELIILADATQLQQVLMNLLNNARDAVFYVSQPKISCSLKAFVATADFAKAHPDIKGEAFALLSVRDNGSGIEKEHLQKVFEPFFTTKGVGEGTGLGLAMVYGAVQSHGGAIEVESEEGKGTAFHVYLPLREGAENPAWEEGRAAIKGRGETVLLVDDEESMRSTTCEVLDSLGYKVLSAGDGEEALEIFRAHQGDISLLITDIVMPKMGGAELAKSIRLLDKKVPIIFATGYDKDYAMSSDEKVDQSTIISKPFSYEKLSHLMRSMIDPE